jgi:dipeptidyl aminopeptidase/acylaminoacyl peptidase
MRCISLVWITAGCLPLMLSARAEAGSFTIEQVLSVPFVESLTASRRGPVAWVENRQGNRNVWVAEPVAGGTYRVSEFTHYRGDDGNDLGELSWDPSGRTLVYARGGSFDDASPENTLSLPLGPSMSTTVWAVSADIPTPRLIGPGQDPAAAPGGSRVAYLHENSLWLANLAGSTAPRPVVQNERSISAFAWSPDGSRIAFVSEREQSDFEALRSFIGVYDLARKSLVWMAPSFDHDFSPAWSPDGRELAFVRIPVGTKGEYVRYGTPWSIWVASAATGQGHEVWRANQGPGSIFYPGSSSTALLWGAGDQLIFKWERTGWLNLYTVSSGGGAASPLATGSFEVADMTVTPDGRTVVFSSNKGDPDRQHVWEVPVAGGPAVALTRGTGIEASPAIDSSGQILVLHGNARLPLEPTLVRGNGTLEPLNPRAIPKEFPASQLVLPQEVTFRAPDGLEDHAQLFLPPHDASGVRHPAIVFYHGGPERQMLLGWHPVSAYAHLYGMNQYLANRGYVVLSVNYRESTGYGLDYRNAPHFGPFGASEFQDELGAARYLDSRTDVDSKRIGVYGGSYGGVMVAMALARASDLYAAGVDYAGIHDWRTFNLEAAPGAYFTPVQLQLAYDSSAIAAVKTWRSPVLIFQSDNDHNVPISQSEELITALRANGQSPQTIVLPNEIHDMLRHASWLEFLGDADRFFAEQFGMKR